MSRTFKSIRVWAAAGALLALAAPAFAQGWWNSDWQYRREVTVTTTQPSGLPGDDVAVVNMATGGKSRADGGDVRVVTARGEERPSRVLMVGPGDQVSLAFAVKPGEGNYHVYFGCADPPAMPADQALELRRGVLLQSWVCPNGAIDSLRNMQEIFRAEKRKEFLGAGLLDRVFIGNNPFGPQNNVAWLFTGWLVCPTEGQYTFVCNSRNASFLLIDDKPVVHNGGIHEPGTDAAVNGQARLAAGLHKLTVYYANPRGGWPIVAAAWRPPGETRARIIPPGSFAPYVEARCGPMRKYGQNNGVDFIIEHSGEAFVPERYYQRYTFRAVTFGNVAGNTKFTWDFGDGQKGAGATVEHVYLTDGPHTVTMSASATMGLEPRSNVVQVARPWDVIIQNKLDDLKRDARIVAGYDLAALRTAALAEAGMLLARAGEVTSVVKAGAIFVAREDASDAAAEEFTPVYAGLLAAQGKAGAAVDALETVGKRAKAPRTAAALLVQAGRLALEPLGDVQRATGLFQAVLQNYERLTSAEAMRPARIGMGDAYRSAGRRDNATVAYAAAGAGLAARGTPEPLARGNFARWVEDCTRRKDYQTAQDKLDEWADALPADKLDGYWSLLKVRLCRAAGRDAEAAAEAEILLGVAPNSPHAPDLLKLAYEAYAKLSRKDQADKSLKRLVEKYPESPLATWAAEKLRKP